MTLEDDYVSLKTILLRIRQMQDEGQTGLLELESIQGHEAYLGFKNGKIVSARYRRIKRGARAIDEIRKISSAHCSFRTQDTVPADPKALNLDEALEGLLALTKSTHF